MSTSLLYYFSQSVKNITLVPQGPHSLQKDNSKHNTGYLSQVVFYEALRPFWLYRKQHACSEFISKYLYTGHLHVDTVFNAKLTVIKACHI